MLLGGQEHRWGWTPSCQLFWWSLGYQGLDPCIYIYTYTHICIYIYIYSIYIIYIYICLCVAYLNLYLMKTLVIGFSFWMVFFIWRGLFSCGHFPGWVPPEDFWKCAGIQCDSWTRNGQALRDVKALQILSFFDWPTALPGTVFLLWK